jgi:hypothetical protein
MLSFLIALTRIYLILYTTIFRKTLQQISQLVEMVGSYFRAHMPTIMSRLISATDNEGLVKYH